MWQKLGALLHNITIKLAKHLDVLYKFGIKFVHIRQKDHYILSTLTFTNYI